MGASIRNTIPLHVNLSKNAKWGNFFIYSKVVRKGNEGLFRMSEIINFNGKTRLDIPSDRVLESAKGQLEGVVVIGWDKEGEEYFASSIADGGDVLWLLERCKQELLDRG